MGRIRKEVGRMERVISRIAGGDFNARTGEREALEDGEEGVVRMLKNKLING